MTRFFFAILSIVSFCACNTGNGKANNAVTDAADKPASSKTSTVAAGIDYLKADGDSLVIPSFQVEVALSKPASEKLVKDKETIIVAAWFAGEPKDTLSQEYAESGEMLIKSVQLELSDTRIANFDGLKFSKSVYDSLAGKDIRVLVNIFSGRKSSPDNLLDCKILADNMSAVKGQKFVLNCKLISEPDSLPQ